MLLNKYKDVAELIEKGTADDRITAAVLCNYPVSNLNVEHLKESELKAISDTFTPDEWAVYGYCGAVHETAYNAMSRLQWDAKTFLAYARIMYGLVLAHKSARQTGETLTRLFNASANKETFLQVLDDSAPTLYGWNADGETITPDFTLDFGGTTFKDLLRNASDDLLKTMRETKGKYSAFMDFREKTEDFIELENRGAIYFDDQINAILRVMRGHYSPFPEYTLRYVKEYAELSGVDMKDLPPEILEIDYFPTWGMMTGDKGKAEEESDKIMKNLTGQIRDYARIVSSATGLTKFYLGGFLYETGE